MRRIRRDVQARAQRAAGVLQRGEEQRGALGDLPAEAEAVGAEIAEKRQQSVAQPLAEQAEAAGSRRVAALRPHGERKPVQRLAEPLRGQAQQAAFGDVVVDAAVQKRERVHVAVRRNARRGIFSQPAADAEGAAAAGPDADEHRPLRAGRAAQRGEKPFPAEQYVNRIPVKKHDHVLIPAGTVHCSGAGTMVLEISATPYIFTFKLWDWGRVDLDGKPRPIHIDRGLANIQWDRDTEWVRDNLVGRETQVYADDGCTVERTGLHEREFIDTFRVSTAREASVRRNGSVHVLNLVEGRSAQLVSTTGAFAPFALHYAETCIVPEAAGDYKIVSEDGRPVKAVIACVRG